MATSSWVDHIEGTLPADDLRRAFVMGAKWWHLITTGATMYSSEREVAEEHAEKFFPDGKLPTGSGARDSAGGADG